MRANESVWELFKALWFKPRKIYMHHGIGLEGILLKEPWWLISWAYPKYAEDYFLLYSSREFRH